jgi:hypothetical protein
MANWIKLRRPDPFAPEGPDPGAAPRTIQVLSHEEKKQESAPGCLFESHP